MTNAINKLKLKLALLVLLTACCVSIHAAPGSTNSASSDRDLMVDPSSMPLAGGTATLTIGPLRRTNGIYSGVYRISVSPYFFKNEKGKLAIIVSDESMSKINRGKAATIIGSATTNGKGGLTRHVDATATPANANSGKIKLWFMAGDRKMTFEPAYHFAEKALAQATEASLAVNSAVTRPEALAAAVTRQ
jgi:hypothetical protein